MRRKILVGLAAMFSVLALPGIAFAHVVVTPNTVGVAAFQTFTVSVPTEKDLPTVALKLELPAGLQHVSPTVKPGWQVNLKKTGSGDNVSVTEIDWTGGSIPADFRDEFSFSAQAPAKPETLKWKAYQTYQDGSIVAWDETPGQSSDNPYSTTKVVNDLSTGPAGSTSETAAAGSSLAGAYVLSGVALALAIAALMRKKK